MVNYYRSLIGTSFFESHINLFTLIARNRSEKPSVERKRLHKRKFELTI